MNIARICKREIVTIDQNASLREAAALMRSQHVGALVVTAEQAPGRRAVGVVTDRDLAIDVLARELEPSSVKIGQLAHGKLAAVPARAGIGDAVAVMQQAGVRRLLVTGQDGEIAGFVSSDDLLDALATELGGLAQALRSGIARESAERQAIARPVPQPVFLPAGTPGMPWPGTGN